MMDTSNETEALITSIKTRSEGEEDASQAIHLIRLIPYAGGVIASIIRENASRRRLEKVCDVLSDLNARLEEKGASPEQYLSKDQIIEVVHETLQTVASASDQKKIESLKRGLAYTFLSDDSFERKQLLLQVLRGCTSLELAILSAIYEAGDPFMVYEKRQPPLTPRSPIQPGSVFTSSDFVTLAANQIQPLNGEWVPIGNREACGEESLLAFFAKRIAMDEGATEGAVRLLDGKGLASAGPNLQRRDCKVLKWQESPNAYGFLSPNISPSLNPTLSFVRSEIRPTPLEASQTKFGKDFLRFCMTSMIVDGFFQNPSGAAAQFP